MAGNDPIVDPIILTRGADFVAEYRSAPTDAPIDPGTTARIEITADTDSATTITATWGATEVTADTVSFRIESEVADLIPDGYTYRMLLSFPDTPTLDYCWYRGRIKRKQ